MQIRVGSVDRRIGFKAGPGAGESLGETTVVRNNTRAGRNNQGGVVGEEKGLEGVRVRVKGLRVN